MKYPISSLLVLMTGCDVSEDDTGSAAGFTSDTLEICSTSAPADEVWISDASIAGDTLTIDVGFGGGCEAHQLQLCWDGSIAESYPPQVYFWISHDANGDSCEAAMSEIMEVDISSIGVSPAIVYLDSWSGSLSYE